MWLTSLRAKFVILYSDCEISYGVVILMSGENLTVLRNFRSFISSDMLSGVSSEKSAAALRVRISWYSSAGMW